MLSLQNCYKINVIGYIPSAACVQQEDSIYCFMPLVSMNIKALELLVLLVTTKGIQLFDRH